MERFVSAAWNGGLPGDVTAGYHRADRFHRFLEVDRDDRLVDPRFSDCATDRTDRFMVSDRGCLSRDIRNLRTSVSRQERH
jgi:hypothetical protein